MAGLLDRIRKSVDNADKAVNPLRKAGDAMQGAVDRANQAQYDADERKYGPRIAREEQAKRLAATSRAVRKK